MKSVWIVLCLVGCSDYHLSGRTDQGQGGDTDGPPPVDGDGDGDLDCAVDVLPGFDAGNNEACAIEAETGTFTPVVEWYQGTFAKKPAYDQIMSAPIVVSLTDDNGDGAIDDDDVPDIVVVTYNESDYYAGGVLRAISGDGSREIFAVADSGIQGTGGAAAGDIDGDGLVEIVALTPTGAVAFENDGTIKWTNYDLSGHISGTSDVPAISDMNHDGSPEIIAGNAILNADGTLHDGFRRGMGGVEGNNVGTCSFAVDIDRNGKEELITGNTAYKYNGEILFKNDLSDGYPAVGNFDSDDEAEIVVSGQGELRLLDTDYTLKWKKKIPGADAGYYGGAPTVADFDGDGRADIGVASGSRYTVFKRSGDILWQAVTDDSSSGNTGSAVFDFEGDGAAEVVYADQSRLWVFNGADGAVKLDSTEHSNGTWLEYPVIADVDGDGHAEIVTVNTTYGTGFAGFHVFGDKDDSWMPGRKIWNQYAYHITNVNDDGTIPVTADLNWLTYNNFRSGAMSTSDGLLAPDLLLAPGDVCEVDCDEGRVVVQLHPGNQGAVDVSAAEHPVVDLYLWQGGVAELAGSQEIPTDLVTGQFLDSMTFDLDGVEGKIDKLTAEIRAGELECDESNNTIEIEGPFCE